jgi:hypothetical protein
VSDEDVTKLVDQFPGQSIGESHTLWAFLIST